MPLYTKRNLPSLSGLFCFYAALYFYVHDHLALSAFDRVVCKQDVWIEHESEQVSVCIADLADECSSGSSECLATIPLMRASSRTNALFWSQESHPFKCSGCNAGKQQNKCVVLVLIVLIKRIIKSAGRESEYCLQYARQGHIFNF